MSFVVVPESSHHSFANNDVAWTWNNDKLTNTYRISVYVSKKGHDDSETDNIRYSDLSWKSE